MKLQTVETVTITQAKDTIAQAARIYFARDRQGRYRVERRRARPLCLMGPAGVGKTEVVRQVAREQGLAFLSYSITHHTRQSAIGLPRLVDGTVEGRRVSMTEYTMSEIVAQVYRTMEDTRKTEGVLFLDEFNCASESLRPILLQLLQDKSFGPHAIPDGWMLVLAGNPTEYNRAASELDPVTADRLRMVHIRPDYAAWLPYAKKKGVHPVILSYLKDHRDHFYLCRADGAQGTALVTARAWEDLSVMLTCLEETGEQVDLPLVAQYLQSGEVARGFYQYCAQYQTMVASGLLEDALNRGEMAVNALSRMDFNQAWNLVSALVRRTETLCMEALELAATELVAQAALQPLLEDEKKENVQALFDAAAQTDDLPARQFLEDCVPLAQAGDWMAVREQLALKLSIPRLDALQQAVDAVEAVSYVCRTALEGKPHLEYLVNCFQESEAIAHVIGQWETPEFVALTDTYYLDPEEEGDELFRSLQDPDDPDDGEKEAV